jgi:hypothetical protein
MRIDSSFDNRLTLRNSRPELGAIWAELGGSPFELAQLMAATGQCVGSPLLAGTTT